MMTGSRRRRAVGAIGVASIGLLLASPAYACTVFRGQITASGNGAGNVEQTAKGKAGLTMAWCPDYSPYAPKIKVENTAPAIAFSTATTPAPGTEQCPVSSMIAGNYEVKVTAPGSKYMGPGGSQEGVAGTSTWAGHNCHSDFGTPIGTGTVGTDGVYVPGTAVPLTPVAITSTIYKSNLCVYNVDLPSNGCPFCSVDAIAINFDYV